MLSAQVEIPPNRREIQSISSRKGSFYSLWHRSEPAPILYSNGFSEGPKVIRRSNIDRYEYREPSLTEADTATQSVDQGEGVGDQLGPGDLHHLVIDDEHVQPLGLHVGALVVCLVGHGGAGRGTLTGLGGVETGVKLEQEVEQSPPRLGRECEGSALSGVVCKPQWDAANDPGELGLDLRLQT